MFYKILFSIMLSTFLYGGEIVWSSGASQSVSNAEYNEAIREYVAQKYSKELKAWEEEEKKQQQKRDKEIAANSVTLGKLMWQDDEAAKTVRKDWEGAIEYCKSLKLLGFDDWRLPKRMELLSITDKSKYYPAIKNGFKNVTADWYWSSSPLVSNSSFAWFVGFRDGSDGYGNGDGKTGVRCVRDSK